MMAKRFHAAAFLMSLAAHLALAGMWMIWIREAGDFNDFPYFLLKFLIFHGKMQRTDKNFMDKIVKFAIICLQKRHNHVQ